MHPTLQEWRTCACPLPTSSHTSAWGACMHACAARVCARVPGLAGDEDLAGVHDAAGQARRVDGAQGRAQLDDVGPDQRLGQQAGVLPRRRWLVLTYKKDKECTCVSSSARSQQVLAATTKHVVVATTTTTTLERPLSLRHCFLMLSSIVACRYPYSSI